MYKYILTLIMIPLLSLSQTNQPPSTNTVEFLTNYNTSQSIDRNGFISEKKPVLINMVFNYNNTTILKVYTSNSVNTYAQETTPKFNKTLSGLEYQEILYKNIETATLVNIQIFTDTKYGTRIIFIDNSILMLTYE